MRLVEFLIELLSAQAQTLSRLEALFTEEHLLRMLEDAADPDEVRGAGGKPAAGSVDPSLFEGPEALGPHPATGSAYAELEHSVREFHLPEVLEFHLWAFPHYRAFIESSIDLEATINEGSGVALVEEALAQSNAWIDRLPISEAARAQARQAAHVPWLRFRTQVLKRVGRRPLGPVY